MINSDVKKPKIGSELVFSETGIIQISMWKLVATVIKIEHIVPGKDFIFFQNIGMHIKDVNIIFFF